MPTKQNKPRSLPLLSYHGSSGTNGYWTLVLHWKLGIWALVFQWALGIWALVIFVLISLFIIFLLSITNSRGYF